MRRRIKRLGALAAVLALLAVPCAAFGQKADGGTTTDGGTSGDQCVPQGTAGSMCPP